MFSADARFVMSGSDDGNVRIWKANASEKLGVVTARERAAIEYRDKLKERWMVDKEVERVVRYVGDLFQIKYFDPNLVNPRCLMQNTPFAQVYQTDEQAQGNNVGCEKSQGGAKKKTYAFWREQTQARAEESCYCRADINSLVMPICGPTFCSKVCYFVMSWGLITSVITALRASARRLSLGWNIARSASVASPK